MYRNYMLFVFGPQHGEQKYLISRRHVVPSHGWHWPSEDEEVAQSMKQHFKDSISAQRARAIYPPI
jgi:hypothetical protein